MTGMWRAGISSKRGGAKGWGRSGFTLIELIVVIAILSTVLLIAFPGIKALEGYGFTSDARRMAGLIRRLDDVATTDGLYYRFWFYVEEGSVKVEASRDGEEFTPPEDHEIGGFSLGRTTEIEDVVIAGLGKVSTGEAAVIFNPSAGADPFNLHLRQGDSMLTLSYNPYSGKVKIIQGYV